VRARQYAGGPDAHVRALKAWAARVDAGDSCFAVRFGSQRATCCSAGSASARGRTVVTYGAMRSESGLSHEVSSAEAEQKCASFLRSKLSWVHKKELALRAKQDAQVKAVRVVHAPSTWEESTAADVRSINVFARADPGDAEPDLEIE